MELNVATNRLEFVPSELLTMNLTNIHLHPNPFRPNPNIALKRPTPETTRFGESRVPPLSELCLRRLLGTARPSVSMFDPPPLHSNTANRQPPSKTLFETLYELPLPIEGPDKRPFCGEKPAYEQSVEEGGPITGIGRCPNPSHDGTKIYICPAEQRFTWEKSLENGVQVGAPVPVRWRGCMWGCLDFLGTFDEKECYEGQANVNVNADGEAEEVVQVVNLGAGDLDF
ncbi:hypothetical protein BJ165DRAFT_1438642, partial [Panaeolus papilionaceus]